MYTDDDFTVFVCHEGSANKNQDSWTLDPGHWTVDYFIFSQF